MSLKQTDTKKYKERMLIGYIPPKSKIEQTFSLMKLFWMGGKFIVKNVPTVLGIGWKVKKEVSDEIVNAIQEVEKERKKSALENKIKELQSVNKK